MKKKPTKAQQKEVDYWIDFNKMVAEQAKLVAEQSKLIDELAERVEMEERKAELRRVQMERKAELDRQLKYKDTPCGNCQHRSKCMIIGLSDKIKAEICSEIWGGHFQSKNFTSEGNLTMEIPEAPGSWRRRLLQFNKEHCN